ncbi:hypothetical protein [Rhodococcus sp. NPDC004095]
MNQNELSLRMELVRAIAWTRPRPLDHAVVQLIATKAKDITTMCRYARMVMSNEQALGIEANFANVEWWLDTLG